MPYEIRKGGGSCAKAEWAVVKKASGASVGCHKTRASALKQLAALQINVMSKEDAMPNLVLETATISEKAAAAAKKTGVLPVQFISPGWGSSGYYSPEVLQEAATERVIPKGTHMYADHPTDTEAIERPGRSIKDLMAITIEDARVSDDGALVGEVQVVPAWQPFIETVREHIGVSIRGDAKDITMGEAEGRQGRIIEGLAHVASVDFVTRAGRGGKILTSLMESAAANRRAMGHGIAEATVNDTREQLDGLLKETYGGDKVWVYVRDFDASTVWFCVSSADSEAMYAQGYTLNGSDAPSLDGDRTEVRQVTTYVPVKAATENAGDDAGTPNVPDHPAGHTTEESEEDTMGKIQIEEAEHSALLEKAGRVTALEERATKAEAELASRDRRDAARKIVDEADAEFDALQVKGLLADLPVKEGQLDAEAFKATVDEAAAKVKEAAGAGSITGFGGAPSGGAQEISEDDFEKTMAGAFRREG